MSKRLGDVLVGVSRVLLKSSAFFVRFAPVLCYGETLV